MCKFLYKQKVTIFIIILSICFSVFLSFIGSGSAPNSSYASQCDPTAALKPDLTGYEIEIINAASSYVRVTVENSGERHAESILVYIVLSESTNLADYYTVYEYTISFLGVTDKDVNEVSIDDLNLSGVPEGDYYVGAIVDPLGKIEESVESNNSCCSSSLISISGGGGNISIGIE